MKREIKFRAWHKGMNKMLSENEWHHYGPKMVKSSLQSYDHEIMQFTGLHDKNGKEIYEGDIVKFQYGDFSDPLVCFIKYDESTASFSIPNDNTDTILSIEVIGNIYENPELIHQP